METVLFHAMDGAERVVVFSMDQDCNRTVYCSGSKVVDEAWPQCCGFKPHLEVWFKQHVGHVAETPRSSHSCCASEYPRGLAVAPTPESSLSLGAYVTRWYILVLHSQVDRALGVARCNVDEHLDAVGITPHDKGDSYRAISVNDLQRAFGQDVVDRLLLRAGQIAHCLGVPPCSVPNIVERLGIGIPVLPQVNVPWGTLWRVKRTSPRSFELRDA